MWPNTQAESLSDEREGIQTFLNTQWPKATKHDGIKNAWTRKL